MCLQIADKRKSLLRFVQDVESRDLLEDFHQSAPFSVSFLSMHVTRSGPWVKMTEALTEFVAILGVSS